MLQHRTYIALLSCVLQSFIASAQEVPNKAWFINPMDIPMELSGNFMEPRNDHFHSGLDIRTQGQEGIPVKAAADGWVSRIKISPWGYGKAVYIDHPNGYTSVYGHLQVLKGALGDACREQQYRQKDFSIDWTPEKGAIPVVQGEVIALSGNTGGSGGPHLHFELRRTGDQHALDPEALGMVIRDRTPPEIHGIRLYTLTDSSRTAPYPAKALGFAAQGGAGTYTLKPNEVPAAYGTIGLAINTLDRYDGSSSKFGVRSIELFVDSVAVFSTRLDELVFDVNRYSNAHMDYALFKGSKMDYHRCYRLPNNKLRIYGKEPAQGRITVEPGKRYQVRFIVTDANGNRSELGFALRGATKAETITWPEEVRSGALFRYDASNTVDEPGFRFTMPALSLYDDAYVRYERKAAPAKAIAPLHVLDAGLTPIQSACELSIAVDHPQSNKALIARIDEKGAASAVGGKLSNGWLTASVKTFGNYTMMLDTVAPVITNLDLRADMKGRTAFRLKVADNLAGIDRWTGTINGEWMLLEYEPKTNTLSHTFDPRTTGPGKKDFKLVVTDDRGNSSIFLQTFTR